MRKLVSMLEKLNYIYPYHQAIGFYLDKAGYYEDSALKLLQKFGLKYDFYLAHQIDDVDYSKEWRLYFPKGL